MIRASEAIERMSAEEILLRCNTDEPLPVLRRLSARLAELHDANRGDLASLAESIGMILENRPQ